jgi:hypothetical protein
MKRLLEIVAVLVTLLAAQSAAAANLLTNGDFATDLSGWTATPTAQATITWDAGTAKLSRTNGTTETNGNYLYQIIPVTSGQQYKVAANWKGDITTGCTDRQWVEVFVAFCSTSTLPTLTTSDIMYKKSTYGGVNVPAGPWDWESILLSPNTSPVPPAGGTFTATNSYMVVVFNIGGRANAGTCYLNVDSVSVKIEPETVGIEVRDASDSSDYTTWAIGTGKSLDTAYIMTTDNCVLVKNTGNAAMDVGLSATGTNWTIASTTGTDQCVLMGLFNGSSAPATGDFNTSYDLLSGSVAWATSNSGNGLFEGANNGLNIAAGSSRKLYMFLKTPSSISTVGKAAETTTVTVSCKLY